MGTNVTCSLLPTTASQRFAQSSGGDFDDSTDWQALFLQWIAGDLREMGVRYSTDMIDWVRGEQGECPGNVYRGDDGQIYFYAGT